MSDEQTYRLEVKGKGTPPELGKDAPPDPEADLFGFIAQDPDVRWVRVSRLRVSGERAFLSTMPVDAFSYENVQQLWGGGAYHIALLNDKKKVRTQTKIDIDGAPRDSTAPPSSSTATTSETELGRMMRELRELREEMRRAPANVNPIDSAVAMMAAMQTATAPLLEAVLKTKQQDPNELFLRALRVGIHLADRGREGKRDPMDRLIEDFAMPLLKQVQTAGVPAQDAPNPPGAPQVQTPPAPNAPPWVHFFAQYVPQLCGYADANKNPIVWAGVIGDSIDDAQADALLELLDRGDEFRAEFFAAFPEAATRREWFGQLMDELHAGLSPEEEPEADGER